MFWHGRVQTDERVIEVKAITLNDVSRITDIIGHLCGDQRFDGLNMGVHVELARSIQLLAGLDYRDDRCRIDVTVLEVRRVWDSKKLTEVVSRLVRPLVSMEVRDSEANVFGNVRFHRVQQQPQGMEFARRSLGDDGWWYLHQSWIACI